MLKITKCEAQYEYYVFFLNPRFAFLVRRLSKAKRKSDVVTISVHMWREVLSRLFGITEFLDLSIAWYSERSQRFGNWVHFCAQVPVTKS
jgi:hypothetical protein